MDAAFGLAFFDVEVPFEIMVFCLFRDFSKSAQANRNIAVSGPMPFAGGNKTNVSAGEIDLAGTGHVVEIWWRVKASARKISSMLERSVRELGFAIEARVREFYASEVVFPRCLVPLFHLPKGFLRALSQPIGWRPEIVKHSIVPGIVPRM